MFIEIHVPNERHIDFDSWLDCKSSLAAAKISCKAVTVVTVTHHADYPEVNVQSDCHCPLCVSVVHTLGYFSVKKR